MVDLLAREEAPETTKNVGNLDGHLFGSEKTTFSTWKAAVPRTPRRTRAADDGRPRIGARITDAAPYARRRPQGQI